MKIRLTINKALYQILFGFETMVNFLNGRAFKVTNSKVFYKNAETIWEKQEFEFALLTWILV